MRKILTLLMLIYPFISSQTNELNISIPFHNTVVETSPEPKEILLSAIMAVESSYDSLAYNPSEKAAGILQIRPIMVKEVNRILGDEVYSLEDRWNVEKSKEMFMVFSEYHSPDWDLETVIRNWNGGDKGYRKKSTLPYYHKVLSEYESMIY